MAEAVIPQDADALASRRRSVWSNRRSSFSFTMRYFTNRPSSYSPPKHARVYRCNHPVYDRGTLYFRDGIGLVVIQQRYDASTKRTWWGEIDSWLVEAVYEHPSFEEFFSKNAVKRTGDIFPTFTIRQVMWALRMKPLKKHPWETVFDRKPL